MCKSLSNTSINLKTIRESLGCSRKEFAELAERDGQVVKLWETGMCSPNAESMFHLANNIEARFGIRINLNTVITGTVPFFGVAVA